MGAPSAPENANAPVASSPPRPAGADGVPPCREGVPLITYTGQGAGTTAGREAARNVSPSDEEGHIRQAGENFAPSEDGSVSTDEPEISSGENAAAEKWKASLPRKKQKNENAARAVRDYIFVLQMDTEKTSAARLGALEFGQNGSRDGPGRAPTRVSLKM